MRGSSRTTPVAIVAMLLVLLFALCAQASAATETGTGVIDEPQPCASLCEPPPKIENPPPSNPAHTILIVSVGWNSGNPATSTGLEKHQLQTYVDYYRGKLNQWYGAQVPGFIPWDVKGAGEFMIPPPHLPGSDPETCGSHSGDRGTFFDDVVGNAETAVRKAGINPNAYWDFVVQYDKQFCERQGATRGDRTILSALGATPMHELGHYLGIDHAERLRCVDAGGQIPVTLSDKCSLVGYGDQYDDMGGGTGAFNAFFAHELGWLGSSEFTELSTGPYTQTVILKPWTGGARDHRALRLTDGGKTFWFEFRTGTGVDAYDFVPGGSSHTAGVVVHRESFFAADGGLVPRSELLDMSPSYFYPKAEYAPMTPGKTWVIPSGSMTVTEEGGTGDGAVILKISSRFVPVPDLVGGDRKNAVTRIGAAGLHFAGSTIVKTTNCDEIGKVVSTTPPAGTGVEPGTDVTVKIGEGNIKLLCQ